MVLLSGFPEVTQTVGSKAMMRTCFSEDPVLVDLPGSILNSSLRCNY